MSRQIDVKALVSHIVKGDGQDKCRICMGDTSEGQVYLGDTVMMDGENSVTLSELLETITGVEVPVEEDLPSGLCCSCFSEAIAAIKFRDFCVTSSKCWNTSLELLEKLPNANDVQTQELFAILTDSNLVLINNDGKTKIKKQVNENHHKKLAKSKCQCMDCGKKFLYSKDLYRHLKDSVDKHACYICARVMTRNLLVDHIKSDHNVTVFSCKKCPALFMSLNMYKEHKTRGHTPGSLCCGDCGRTFINRHAYYGHLNMHSGKSCPSCDKVFQNHRCYLYHVKQCCNLDDTKLTNNKPLFEVKNNNSDQKFKVGLRGRVAKECECDYCGKKFAGKKFVFAHIQTVHMKTTHRPCPYCGTLIAAAYMTIHLKKHQPTTLHTCEHCGYILKSKLGYIQHVRLHTGERPYQCKYCPETFSASSRRSDHVRRQHKNPNDIILRHACELCPAKFRLPYKLRMHVASVHAESKDKVEYECPDCHIKFSTCRGLLHHSRMHQTFTFKKKDQLKKIKSEAN